MSSYVHILMLCFCNLNLMVHISNHLVNNLFLGFEVIVQVTISILLLLLNRTNTATTGGLEAIFDEGKSWNATTILAVSVTWSIFSTINTHTNLTILEKGFCPTTSKLVVLAWATFATLRRILSLVVYFIPSLGLCSLLYHLKWEQVPYEIAGSISPGEPIRLFGLNKTVLWSQLDRWNYTDPEAPTPPSYTAYTLLTLQETFIALMMLAILQFIAILVVKIEKFKKFFPLNKKDHNMSMRNSEKFALEKCGSVRYSDSALPYMKRLLNKYQLEKNKILKVLSVLMNHDASPYH